MARIKLRSVRHKLFVGVLLTSLAAILFTGAALLFYDLHTLRDTLRQDLSTQAELIGRACVPALQFDDPKVANDNLALLAARPAVDAAALYNAKGAVFGRYARGGGSGEDFPKLLVEGDAVEFSGNEIYVTRHIVTDNEVIGSIYLRAHYDLFQRVKSYLGIVLAVGTLALLISLALSFWLQATVTKPILAITGLAQKVAEKGDFSLRAEKITDDEIGYLTDSFNRMLGEVGGRTEALEREIGDRKTAEAALRNSEKRYRALVSTLSSVVWVANKDWGFEGEQASWEAYTGQNANEYRGKGWQRAFHPDDLPELERAIGRYTATRQSFEVELRLWQAATAQYRIVSLKPMAVVEEYGALREWIGTVTDIDDRRRAEDEVHRLNIELEGRVRERTYKLQQANSELEAFSYSVSHDLRAPLRAIDGFSQTLLIEYGDRVEEKMRGYLNRIKAGAARMGQLIEDLLSLSRISRLELQRDEVDVSAIAHQVLSELQQREPERMVNVSIWDGVTVEADPRLVRVALENLLGNAWKFTSKSPNARVEFGMMQEGARKVLFVRDNGAGFDMAYADKLYGPFQRLHGMHEFPGTGIGLATVARIVTRHGGRIWCQAKPDMGATFFFTLQEDPRAGAGTAQDHAA